jgi:sugar lactone lactonase YvrE
MIHCLLSFAAVAGIFFTDIAASQTQTPTIAIVATGLGRPFGVAIHGNAAYVPDALTHKVWKVDLTPGTAYGTTTAVAGTGEQGYNGDGINPTLAQLDNPSSVAVDASGALYIADTGNHVVRKVAAPGVSGALITTVAGIPASYAVGESTLANCATVVTSQCAPATGLRLFGPRALALDSAGNLYIADRMNQQIKKLYTSGPLNGFIFVVAGVAGFPGSIDGPITAPVCPPFTEFCPQAAQFNSPVGLAVDASGNVYVAEEGGSKIRFIPGNPDGPPSASTLSGTTGSLLRPTGVALGANGVVYIANYGNNVISLRSCPVSCGTTTVAGTGTAGNGGTSGGPATSMQLNSPIAVALDGNLLYIADLLNGRLLAVNLAVNLAP